MISADGVAPRAKMNQQRSRRYRKTDVNKKELDALRKQGLDPEKMFNSDVISAGTEFMFLLSKAFDKFVQDKLQSDPLWKNLRVVLTGVDVPGEGEHKIIEYIRQYKNKPDYDPNGKHCIYGLDADLIMLSLITHEPNICILREEVFGSKKSAKDSCVRGMIKLQENFEFIYVSILREYLELEFLELKPKLKFEYNIERVIDDFIFFCFFIGNDFLPNLNTLDIDHGALDNIFTYYKDVLPSLDDYITYHGKIDFKKAEKIFALLAGHELGTIKNMLKKVQTNIQTREKKRNKTIEDKKKILKCKKLLARKEDFLTSLKSKGEAEIVDFKKKRINKKIDAFRKKYENAVKATEGKAFRFEEDIEDYLKKEVDDQIRLMHVAGDNKDKEEKGVTSSIYSDSGLSESDVSSNFKGGIANNNVNTNITNNEPVTLENQKGLTMLFDSDDEGGKQKEKGNTKTKYTKGNNKSNTVIYGNKTTDGIPKQKIDIQNILKSASKYSRYIKDNNYCSDINIDDISDADIGVISDPELLEDDCPYEEGFNKNLEENQDMDQVFQKKLVDLYINDVSSAKAFYYKEKLKIDLETPEGKEEHKNMFRKYLEGLQWVLFYYYRGIQSWRWYYPYHYAPMISDFNNIKEYLDYDIENCFDYGEPYSPFQSLLFILPKTSRDLFPKCYWSIYEEMSELFPQKFGIDFNGKKMPWESIVLLPFLPEEKILDFENRQREKFHPNQCRDIHHEHEKHLVLSDYEIERNVHGTSYVYFLENSNNNYIHKEQFEIYQKTNETKLDSNYELKQVDYNFPSLKTIRYDYLFDTKKQYHGKSKDAVKKIKTITLKPLLKSLDLNFIEEIIKHHILNKICYVTYPFKIEAVIRGVSFNNQYYYLNTYSNKLSVDPKGKIPNEIKDTIRRDWFKKGVSIDERSNIFVDVSLLRKLVRNSDGTLEKVYDSGRFYVPFEVTSLNFVNDDYMKLKKEFEVFSKRFTKIETEFIIDKEGDLKSGNDGNCILFTKPHFGMMGKITNIIFNNHPNYKKFNTENYSKYYDKNFNFDLEGKDWEITLDKLYNGPLLEVVINSANNIENLAIKKLLKKTSQEYITLVELSKQINVSTWSLGLITSSLFVVNCAIDEEISEDAKLSELEHWNIGFNLKSKNKFSRLILPGYTRYIEDSDSYSESHNWEFSESAVNLIKEYKDKYPFVFDCLEKYKNLYNRSNKFFRNYELFSTVDDIDTKLTEVAVWINSKDLSTANFTDYKSTFLSVNDCRNVEDYVNSKNAILKENKLDNSTSTIYVNPNYILQETLPYVPPFMAYEPPPFHLGDRVANIRSNDSIYIPFGLKGTVTAVTNEFIEVLFDQEFIGGCNLNGRFKNRKAAYVKPINLINLTNKMPIYLRRNKSKYYTWDFQYNCGNYDGVYAYSYALEKSNKHGGETGGVKIKRQRSDAEAKDRSNIVEVGVALHKTHSLPSEVNDNSTLEKLNNMSSNVHSINTMNPVNKNNRENTNTNTNTNAFSYDNSVYQQKVPKIITKNRNDININTNTTTNAGVYTDNQISSTTGGTSLNPNYTNNVNSINITTNLSTATSSVHPPLQLDANTPSYVPKRILTKDKRQVSSSYKTNPEGAKLQDQVQYVNNEKTLHRKWQEIRILFLNKKIFKI
jgi:5'-3' exonuclease